MTGMYPNLSYLLILSFLLLIFTPFFILSAIRRLDFFKRFKEDTAKTIYTSIYLVLVVVIWLLIRRFHVTAVIIIGVITVAFLSTSILLFFVKNKE